MVPRPLRPMLAVVAALLPAVALAQSPGTGFPAATTLEALALYPGFYHLKAVVVRGELSLKDSPEARLVPAGGAGRGVELLLRGDQPSSGLVEIRGQFLDVGRLRSDDASVAGTRLSEIVRARVGERWPAHGELLAIAASAVTPVPPPSPAPSLRQLSLDPERYEGQRVLVRGRFAGRNLLGDLPQAPRISLSDFVISNAGGAVWVAGIEPRGRGWRLDAGSKLDTDQWLQVEGVVHFGDGLVWLQANGVAQARADSEAEPQPAATAMLPAPPPEVVFTLPAQDETDVSPSSSVRLQVSRDLDPDSLARSIRVGYLGQPGGAPGVPFKATFDPGQRVLELKFDQPLERFRTVKVELQDGIKGTDGQALKPFTLTFTVGG